MEPREALLVSLVGYAGLRPGEVLSLRWHDFDGDKLHVDSAISLGEERTTKTKRARDVRLLAPVKADLLSYRMLVGRPSDTELIFPAHDGCFWSSSDWRNSGIRRSGGSHRASEGNPSVRPQTFCCELVHRFGRERHPRGEADGTQPDDAARTLLARLRGVRGRNVDPEALIVEARGRLSPAEHVG
jgi:hypothetical protein